jgi:hypothetical protein
VQDVQNGMFRGQFFGQFAGAIWRIVIHYQDIHRNWKSQQPLHEREKVLTFVIGWHYDQGLVHRYRLPTD